MIRISTPRSNGIFRSLMVTFGRKSQIMDRAPTPFGVSVIQDFQSSFVPEDSTPFFVT